MELFERPGKSHRDCRELPSARRRHRSSGARRRAGSRRDHRTANVPNAVSIEYVEDVPRIELSHRSPPLRGALQCAVAPPRAPDPDARRVMPRSRSTMDHASRSSGTTWISRSNPHARTRATIVPTTGRGHPARSARSGTARRPPGRQPAAGSGLPDACSHGGTVHYPRREPSTDMHGEYPSHASCQCATLISHAGTRSLSPGTSRPTSASRSAGAP